jgi:hypothetical protein
MIPVGKKLVPTFVCENCGKTTEYRESRRKSGEFVSYQLHQRFCSRECGYDGRKWRPINPDGHVHSTGYIRVDLRGGKKAFKHRLVMEDILGRPLSKNESVHHKDGNRVNNDPSNLELWLSRGQPPGQRVSDHVRSAVELLKKYPEYLEEEGYRIVPIEDSGVVESQTETPIGRLNKQMVIEEIL